MAAPFQAHLDKAMAPLLERTTRRVKRLQFLSQQPRTEATDKAMAAEQQEIQLVAALSQELARVVGLMQQVLQHNTDKCHQLGAALQKQSAAARTWEARFWQALEVLPPLPEEKAPAIALTGYAAMIRCQHLRESPDTYRATFPALFPNPTPIPAHV